MRHEVKLKTQVPGLYLGPIDLRDREIYLEWKRRSDSASKIAFSTYRTTYVPTLEDIEQDLQSLSYSQTLAIIYEDKMIGLIGLENILPANQRASLWFEVDTTLPLEKQTELGVASLDAMIRYAYEMLNLNSLIVQVPAFHKQALAIMNRSRMSYLGSRENSEHYLKEDYYNTLYYQTTKELYYQKQTKNGQEIKNKKTRLHINEEPLQEILTSERLTLKKGNLLVEPPHINRLTSFLNDATMAIPLGEFKTNWTKEAIVGHLQNLDYGILKGQDLIGYVNLFQKDDYNHSAAIEIMIASQYQHQGYGKEVLNTLLEETLATSKYSSLLSSIFAFNQASKKLHEAVGFTPFGTRREAYYAYGKLHDMELYQMSSTNYVKRR